MIKLKDYKSGNLQASVENYKFFMPTKVNDQWSWEDQEINNLLQNAAIKLGELNSFAKLVPNVDLFIQLHVTKEAVVSSRIEGTQTSMDEALMSEIEVAPERRDDWKEVQNYIEALNSAIKELDTLPISSRLLCKLHAILLSSVRGENKQPGAFRRSQNWIGGTNPANAEFVPPQHAYVGELMGDLENFIHNQHIQVPSLIRIAIAHYQFETIHPFLDGNGRIGRLLITLSLVDQQILTKPLLYLSTFFEKNKNTYYDKLTEVRTQNNMNLWIKYFLKGVTETSERAVNTLSQVLALKAGCETKITQAFGRKANSANLLLQGLLVKPIVDVKQVQAITGSSYKASNDLVKDFIDVGFLKEMTGQSRNRLFVFESYLNLF
jgi:Fic family protein